MILSSNRAKLKWWLQCLLVDTIVDPAISNQFNLNSQYNMGMMVYWNQIWEYLFEYWRGCSSLGIDRLPSKKTEKALHHIAALMMFLTHCVKFHSCRSLSTFINNHYLSTLNFRIYLLIILKETLKWFYSSKKIVSEN